MQTRYRSEEDNDSPQTVTRTRSISTGTCANPFGTAVTTQFSSMVHTPRLWSRTMSDIVTPNFSIMSKAGKIINNPMNQTETEILDPPVTFLQNLHLKRWDTSCNPDKYLYYQDTLKGTVSSSFILDSTSFLDVPGVSIETEIDQALTRAWANVDDNVFQSLASLGELKETLSSIKDIGIRLFKLLRFVKNLDSGKAWRMYLGGATAKDFADRYMELRYSIRPMISEMKTLAKALDTPKFELNSRKTFRGYSGDFEKNEDTFQTHSVVNTYDSFRTTYHRVSTREIKVRSGVLVDVKSSHWLDRWGFDDVLETAWELTRLSFAVDWFINIGQKIAAFTPEFGLRPLASWIVVEDIQYKCKEITGTSRTYSSPIWTTLSAEYLANGAKYEERRIVRYRVPNPQLRIIPSIKVKLDLFKIADLLVILNQFRGR